MGVLHPNQTNIAIAGRISISRRPASHPDRTECSKRQGILTRGKILRYTVLIGRR